MNRTLHLVAHVGACGVLIHAERVDSVVDVDAIVPAPGAAPGVLGLAAMRSRVATVIDPRHVLGLPRGTGESAGRRAVVTAVDGHLYAIAVDTLEDVAFFSVSPPPPGLGSIGPFVSGVVEGEAETLLALDLDRMIAAVDGAVNFKLTPDAACPVDKSNG